MLHTPSYSRPRPLVEPFVVDRSVNRTGPDKGAADEWFLIRHDLEPDIESCPGTLGPDFADLTPRDFTDLYEGSLLCRTARIENTDIGCGGMPLTIPEPGDPQSVCEPLTLEVQAASTSAPTRKGKGRKKAPRKGAAKRTPATDAPYSLEG